MRPASRHPLLLLVLGIVFAIGCGDMSCGCEMQPLDRDLADTDKVFDGVQIEISPQGFTFLEMNFDAIVETFIEGGLAFGLPPDPGGCSDACSETKVCNKTEDCPITAALRNINLIRQQPNVLRVETDLFLHSSTNPFGPPEKIPMRICQKVIWCIPITCDVEINIAGKPLALDVVLDIDPVTNALTFELGEPEFEIVNSDYRISGSFDCSTVEWVTFIKNYITGMINDMITEEIVGTVDETIDDMTCMPCDYYTGGCEAVAGGVNCRADTEWCHPGSSDQCVRAPLGIVGKIDVAEVLGDMGLPSTPIGMHVGVGQRLSPWGDPLVPYPNGPLRLRAITGAAADFASPCVPPPSAMPRTDPPPRVDFVTESGGLNYHVALGVSDRFLNKTIYEAYRGGALCLDIGSEVSDMVSTGLLTAFLPSLGVLTGGKNSPIYIAVRPKDRPEIHIGKGTYRSQGGQTVIDDPLITLVMNDVNMDFYAFFEERYFRLFTLEVDVALPLGLELTPANELIPILGDLDDMVTGIEVFNSNILAEDPQVLKDIIPVIISLVEPMMGEVLDPIPLPDIEGFRLNVVKMEGLVPHAVAGRYEHLGLFAELRMAGPIPSTHVPPPIELRDVRQPRGAGLEGFEAGSSIERPSVVVAVGQGGGEPVEWQYRIGGGFWSPFQTAPVLELFSPKLLLQGRHVLEVRTRQVGRPETLDREPSRFEFLIDWTAPSARILVDPSTGIAEVLAQDAVTPSERLEYSFAVDGGSFTSFGSSSTFELPRGATLLEVKVRDEAGNLAETSWREIAWGTSSVLPATSSRSMDGGGCASATGSGAGASFVLLLLLFAAPLYRNGRRG